MRGGQVFMESLLLHGVDCIFGNPGTTENPLLDRLIDYPQLPYYVALHEGIAVCAASFYAQASGRTAVVNLHVAPGLGNGIGMMYGALKAGSPMLVTAGQQDTRMRLDNPLLSHDLVAMAAPVTKFSAEPRSADEMGPLLRRAFKIANERPCGPVFIALPVDVMEQETRIPASTAGRLLPATASATSIDAALALILGAANPCIVVGDDPARTRRIRCAGDAGRTHGGYRLPRRAARPRVFSQSASQLSRPHALRGCRRAETAGTPRSGDPYRRTLLRRRLVRCRRPYAGRSPGAADRRQRRTPRPQRRSRSRHHR